MHITNLLILTLLSIYITQTNTLEQEEIIKEGCVKLYAECNYEGKSIELCEDISNLAKMNYDNKASSLKIGANTKLELFADADYKGDSIDLKSNHSCFWKDIERIRDMYDNASSLRIIRNIPKTGCIWVYSECNFKGEKKELCRDDEDRMNVEKNHTASIMMGPWTYVTLYKDAGFLSDNSIYLGKLDVDCISKPEHAHEDEEDLLSIYKNNATSLSLKIS